jgi:3-oxoadipate enol-lactonase
MTPPHGWSVQLAGDRHLPAVVLLHSIATRGVLWSPQVAAWSSRFHLIMPDLPGHGATPVEAGPSTLGRYADGIAALLDQFGIARAAIVGVSLGGMVAQAFALRFPERLDAMVLAQTQARVTPDAAAMWTQRKTNARQFGLRAQTQATLERWFTPEFLNSAPMTVAWVAEMIGATGVEGFCAAADAIQGLDFLDGLAQLSVPALVVAGAEDTAAPPAVARAISERLTGSRLAIIEGAAHLANVERPIVFAERVGAFLSEVLPVHPR